MPPTETTLGSLYLRKLKMQVLPIPAPNEATRLNVMICTPTLGQRELEFSGVEAHVGGGADELFMSDIGTSSPIALCGRSSLYSLH